MAFFVSCSERVAMKFGIATGHCGQHTVPQQGELASATKLKETESKKCGKEDATNALSWTLSKGGTPTCADCFSADSCKANDANDLQQIALIS
jgi:hypothetical protein